MSNKINKFINYKDYNLSINSQKVKKNDIFFAIQGTKDSGNNYINEAIKKKSSVIVSDKKITNYKSVRVKNVRKFLAKICSLKYFNKPKNIIAVTGTNGKSSVAHYHYQILKLNNISSSSIGTLGIFYNNNYKKTDLTTPDVVTLHKELNYLKKIKVDNVCIEASSHGLNQERLSEINFKAAIFTNFTQDHLDYHKTLNKYLKAKLYLFTHLLNNRSFAIIDSDIPEYAKIKKICKKRKIKVLSFGKFGNTIKLIFHKYSFQYQIIKINFLGKIYQLKINLIGNFQIKNLFSSMISANLILNNTDKIINIISKLKAPKGRMEIISTKKSKFVIVDYAHTPDALKKSLITLKAQFKKKIDVVFGCGGDRDKNKRYKMGIIAARFADKIYLTNDNPRSENPMSIIRQIRKGCSNSTVILDRKSAIKTAIQRLSSSGILLIAGKGHENYQIIGKKRKKFSDQKTAKLYLN